MNNYVRLLLWQKIAVDRRARCVGGEANYADEIAKSHATTFRRGIAVRKWNIILWTIYFYIYMYIIMNSYFLIRFWTVNIKMFGAGDVALFRCVGQKFFCPTIMLSTAFLAQKSCDGRSAIASHAGVAACQPSANPPLRAYTYTHMHNHIHMHTFTCIHSLAYILVHSFTCIHSRAFIYMYVHVGVLIT